MISGSGLIETRSNDEVWEALEAAAPLSDPFAALATLELAICRSDQDGRFQALPLSAANRLIAERFDGPRNADLYALVNGGEKMHRCGGAKMHQVA
jgi:hypothetical protein